jgi:hypothetical protein
MVKDTPTLSKTPLDEWSAVAEICTWQHTTLSSDRHPCPRRDLNPQFQEASGRGPTPWTSRPMGSADIISKRYNLRSWRSITYNTASSFLTVHMFYQTLTLSTSQSVWKAQKHGANRYIQFNRYLKFSGGGEENSRLLLRKSYVILFSKQRHIPQHNYAVWIRIL